MIAVGKPRISVIVPALNEAQQLARVLQRARQGQGSEIIVADGASQDETAAVGRRCGALVIQASRGRARQMNAGAAVASGDLLLFLHADTLLPRGYDAEVKRILQLPGVSCGAFRLQLAAALPSLRLIEALANWRTRRLQLPYGDQALFLRKVVFDELGGYPDLPIMEDFELVRLLRRRGRVVMAPLAACTSARRWQRLGPWKATLLNQLILAAYLSGVRPATLARWYARP